MKRTTLSDVPLKGNYRSQNFFSLWTKKSLLLEIIIVALILLFAYAAISKLMDYENFIVQIGQNPILEKHSKWLSMAIPAVELITCLTLIIPKFRLIGLYLSFALMLSFTVYIGAILTLSANIPCSCGGVLDNLGWKSHLVFNLAFATLSFVGIRLEKKQREI